MKDEGEATEDTPILSVSVAIKVRQVRRKMKASLFQLWCKK